MCGKLDKSMYGTRDAAQNWEETYVGFMESLGFQRGRASPCVFSHAKRGVRAVIHGDDFTILGFEGELDWFRGQIRGNFEVKFRGRLGPGRGDDKAVRILNRVVYWDAEGIKYEPDQRHAEIIIQQLGLKGKKTAVTPGVNQRTRRMRRGMMSI